MPTSTLKGNWTYRSFINDPAPVGSDPQKALALIFGEGQLRFTSSDDQIFKAVLDFGGGISSGFDEALKLVELLTSYQVAQGVQQVAQYHPCPPVASTMPKAEECPFKWK